MTPPPQAFTLPRPLRRLGTAQSSFICNRYKTDRAYFAAGDTSVGFTPFTVSRRSRFGLTVFEFDRGTTSVAPQHPRAGTASLKQSTTAQLTAPFTAGP